MLYAIFLSSFCCCYGNVNFLPFEKIASNDSIQDTKKISVGAYEPIQSYELFVCNRVVLQELDRFWRSTGLCPPDPHQGAHKFLLSNDMKLSLFHIGSLPYNGLSQVRIHWMLDLVQIRVFSSSKVIYNFNYLDELIFTLWDSDLLPGFELMGNPSSYFTDFENRTQVYMWKNLIETLAEHYIDIYGAEWIRKWNFETWNEPDHHDFDGLNFTLQGFLNYYDACSEGLYSADKWLKFGGPGGSCRLQSEKSPFCLVLLDHCAYGKNYFTEKMGVRLDFVSFHKKGNATSCSILEEENETLQYIKTNFPVLVNVPFFNEGEFLCTVCPTCE